jgi:hypothetical protein
MGGLKPPAWLRGAGWVTAVLVLVFNAALLWTTL